MCKMLIVLLMLFLPLVQSGANTCGPNTLGSDAEACITGLVTKLSLPLAVVAPVKAFVECVLDGTAVQCQFECAIGFFAAGCDGENYLACATEKTQQCWNACDGGADIFNQGCFSAALGVAGNAPGRVGIVALAGAFSSCADIIKCDVSWAPASILKVVQNLSQDAKNEFCTLLHTMVGQNVILSSLVSFFNC